VIVGEDALSNASPDYFLQLRIREVYDERALFHEWIFESVLKYIYFFVPDTKSDEEAWIRVHSYLS